MSWFSPKLFLSGDRPFYIDLNYGKQINNSVVSDSEFWGGRLGMQVSYSKRLSQEGGIFWRITNWEIQIHFLLD
jgi:hypothetical protein